MLKGLFQGSVLIALMVTSQVSYSHEGAALGERIATQGLGEVTACIICHGDAGQGNAQAGYPRLAGLPQAYLEDQLAHFLTERRISTVMSLQDKALNPEQRTAVAAWFAQLPAQGSFTGGTDQKKLEKGERLAVHGDWRAGLSAGIPACVQCHGPGARGVGTAFPPLAGQNERYIHDQIKAWRDGRRSADPLGMMQVIAERLSEQQIAAVAAWLAQQPVIPHKEPAE